MRSKENRDITYVVKSIDCPIGQGNTANTLTPTIVAILILVDIITQVKHVIHRILASWIAKGVEKAKGKIAAGVDGQANLCD